MKNLRTGSSLTIPVTSDPALFSLTRAQIDACPFGVVELDRDGVVIAYNLPQGRLARRDPSTAIGRNFFTEVAPCTAVRDFQGRFERLSKARADAIERFSFIFRFPWGDSRFWISMVTQAEIPGHVFLLVDIAHPPDEQ